MMTLHQSLEFRLDFDRRSFPFDPQHIARLALGIVDDPGLAAALMFAVGARAELSEQTEGIVGRSGAEPRRMRPRRRLAAVHTNLPGRAMAGRGVLLVFGDGIVAHSGEKVVSGVVLAHMAEAEPPVFVLAVAALGCAMRRRSLAARPFANGMLGPQPPILVGLDPDTVE